jgi:hypothetical protein
MIVQLRATSVKYQVWSRGRQDKLEIVRNNANEPNISAHTGDLVVPGKYSIKGLVPCCWTVIVNNISARKQRSYGYSSL